MKIHNFFHDGHLIRIENDVFRINLEDEQLVPAPEASFYEASPAEPGEAINIDGDIFVVVGERGDFGIRYVEIGSKLRRANNKAQWKAFQAAEARRRSNIRDFYNEGAAK